MPDPADRVANDLLWTLPTQHSGRGDSASRQIRNRWMTDGHLQGLTTMSIVLACVALVSARMAIIFDLAL